MKTYLAEYRKAVKVKIDALRTGLISKDPDAYPRVEFHSDLESMAIDKDYDCRSVSLVVEAISNISFGEAANIAKLLLYGKDVTAEGVTTHTDGLIGVNTMTVQGATLVTDLVSYDTMTEMTEEDFSIFRHIIRIESTISNN